VIHATEIDGTTSGAPFSDGSHRGIEEIRSAIEKTFTTILDEVYEVREHLNS
jgi:hypothetical protein